MVNYQLSTINSQLPEGYKQTEVGVIPDGWQVCSVGQMGEVVTGKALAVNAPGQQRPYLRTKNVFDGQIDIEDILKMPMTDAQFEHFMVLNGDVLLNEGQTLELVGRCALYQDEYPEPCAMQNQLIRFRAKTGVSSVFASHLFRFCQQTGIFSKIALQTTSVAHLGSKRFEGLLLSWPKTEKEQRAIATTLSDVDALIAALDKLIAKKRHIKTATMQQLLTGKKRLPGFGEGKGDRVTEIGVIPEDWDVTTLKLISGSPMQNGVFYKPSHKGSGVKLINVGDLYDQSPINSESLELFNASDDEKSRFRVENGDLFFTRSSVVPSGIAHCNVYFSDRNESVVFDSHVIRVRPDQKQINPAYLFRFCTSPVARKYLVSHAKTGTMTTIDQGVLGKCPVFLPVLSEQRAIASLLSDMDAEITALEARRTKTQAIKQGMMQELLTGRTRLL